MRCLYDPADARRILNPGPVAIVTTAWRGMANAAPIAWTVPLSIEPPLIGVVIHPHRHTADMIRFSDGFAINIPGPNLLKQTAFLATMSGLDNNKIEAAGLKTFAPMFVDAPLIEGCLAWIECTLQDVVRTGDHTLFIGSPIKVQAEDDAYAERWLLESPDKSPLNFLGGNRYSVLGSPLEAVIETDPQGGLIWETAAEREEREEREGREREKRMAEGDEGYDQMLQREAAQHKTVF